MYCFGCWLKLCALVRPHPSIPLVGGLMKDNFEVGQLVRFRASGDLGRVIKVYPDYFGAKQAFKVYGAKAGEVIKPSSVNGIGPLKDGIRDRVIVQWYTSYGPSSSMGPESMDGKDLEILQC